MLTELLNVPNDFTMLVNDFLKIENNRECNEFYDLIIFKYFFK